MWAPRFLLWMALGVTLAVSSATSPPLSCPDGCRCLTTPEGLYKAVCSDLLNLHKYSIRNKHPNINIIDLSHADIEKIHDELNKFTEVVTMDLSYNKIAHLNKFLRGSKKLLDLDLSTNNLKKLDASHLPASLRSLDLTHNMLRDVPTNLHSLQHLKHLQIKDNSLHCSCENLRELDALKKKGVLIDDVKCSSPVNMKGFSWAEYKLSNICTEKKISSEPKITLLEDMMMGDQPIDAEVFAPDTTFRKSMPLASSNDLDAGEVWEGSAGEEDDDSKLYLGITTENSKTANNEENAFESSGDSEIFHIDARYGSEELNISTTEEPGSGDFGSGNLLRGIMMFDSENSSTQDPFAESYDYDGSGDDEENKTSSTTEPFITGLFNPFFLSGNENNITEEPFEIPGAPTVFQGSLDWDEKRTEKPSTEATRSEGILVDEVMEKSKTQDLQEGMRIAGGVGESDDQSAESKQPAKSSVGTYICIGILIFLIVGLIGVTLIRNQSRKKRDRILLRQQKKDIEKAGKEMVDMNRSLLGKPVLNSNETEKKSNGKGYELVPTHDPRNGNKNGTLDSNRQGVSENIQKKEAPDQMSPTTPNAYKPNGSASEPKATLQAEEPVENEPYVSEVDGPLTNGSYPNSNLLSPPSEYIPVYDSGRVIIRMTETPKPKTPVLITRSRSNAGEIIITPSPEPISPSKSTT